VGDGLVVLEPWTWVAFDESGSLDGVIGEPAPTHGWRRVVKLDVWVVTEWHFNHQLPDPGGPTGPSVDVLLDQYLA